MLDIKIAQMVVEPDLQNAAIGPIEIVPMSPPIEVIDVASPDLSVEDVHDAPNLTVEIKLDGIVGADGIDPEKEEALFTVTEDDSDDDHKEKDKNDASESKKNDKWDWASKGAKGFLVWVKERLDSVPKHSGYDTAGLERAVNYLEKIDDEISKAMRLDLDGDLDASQVEHIRSEIEKGLDALNDRIEAINTSKKKKNKKKKADEEDLGLVKEAQKITGVQGIFVTVPLLISRVARVCINGMVSGGHDIEDIFNKQVKKYKLSEREQAETMQLLADMGYNLRQDRGYLLDEDVDTSSSDNMDWAANYKG